MASKSSNIAWVITFAAAFGAYYVWKRGRQGNTPSLLNTDNMKLETDPNLPRGYRNNNPLNIRISNSAWKGKINPSGDKAFEQFVSMDYGYRAALRTMRTYITKYGANTIEKIISRWAPPSENNTLSYISNVCRIINERLNGAVTPDTIVTSADGDLLCAMAYAMSIIENGDKEYTRALGLPNMETIQNGWRMV